MIGRDDFYARHHRLSLATGPGESDLASGGFYCGEAPARSDYSVGVSGIAGPGRHLLDLQYVVGLKWDGSVGAGQDQFGAVSKHELLAASAGGAACARVHRRGDYAGEG